MFALMNHLVDVSVKYVTAQVEAGAELIQISIHG
ncbi:Uroporphyrinogen III decarboxylase [Staphylococcus aureus]|uniref:Uroporphyrinogen III decarboxylase n=1 Tax=Staphylococcus aureus TaxID=1280 RepID=A0A380ELM9_STAAU|nr:Uroporphyrinogen III decarboxylase [Staphylococcus aureus]